MSATNNATNQETSIPHEVNKLALVVGINNSSIAPYRSTLKHAEQDARDMASLLEQPACSFSLLTPALTGQEATSGNIKHRVVAFVKKRTEKDFLLFYYAGHAVPIDNDIYFLTSDFQEENLAFDPDLYLSMRWLWKVLYQSVGAGRVLLILDCCYAGNMVETKDDPFKIDLRKLLDEWNTGSNGKDQKNCLRIVLTATGYNIAAQEQDGHGLMTGHLLKALRGEADEALDKDGHVDIRYLHKYLQEKMPKVQAPDLSGKFGPYNCILASYPERAAQRRPQHRPVRGAEQPQSYIPFPRNPLFQPRPGEFEHLETLLSRGNTEQPARIGLVGVTGMGGIGKTQLAIELAYRLQEQHRFPDGLFWTPATGKTVFEWQHSLAELAFNANYLPPDDDPASPENEARRARHFCRYLANHSDALLILDNVEDPELITSALPTLAGGSLACSILYTSRSTQTPHGVVSHSVEQLSEQASLHLLLGTTRPTLLSEVLAGSYSPEDNAARSVCSMVGHTPLALVHLRSFLVQDRQVSLCRLLEVLNSRGISGIAAKVTETFRLSWEKLRTEEARRMFLLASYFPEATPIPLWLLGLVSGLGENGDIFEPLGQARFELLELSLLEALSNEQVRLHPLVRAFGQQLVKEMADQGIHLLQDADQRLIEVGTDLNWLEGQACQYGYRTCLKHIQEMLDYAKLLSINTSVEALQKIERILDQECHLFCDEHWWPKRVSGLFHQYMYNRALEIGQPVKAKQAPLHWARQIQPSGAMDPSLRRIFAGHTGQVSSVAFSPDGRHILTGSNDHTARLWELSSAKELSKFQGHTDRVSSVAFSPDGKHVLTGSGDGTARLWELSSAKELSKFQGHTGQVSSVAFSPDGKYVLTGSGDGTARLWELSSAKELSKFQGHASWVNSVNFSHL